MLCSRPSVTWMLQGLSTNKLVHMLNGNRNRSYDIGTWNCRKGLVDKENLPAAKINDVKDFLGTNDLQIMYLIEADLHGMTSRIRRVNPITSKKIEENLKVENYRISASVDGGPRSRVRARGTLHSAPHRR